MRKAGMTSIDYLPLLTEVFGPPLTEPSKTPHTRRFGDGSFSGSTTNGQWIEWHDGELIRAGSIEKLHAIHTEFKANGGSGDLRAVLREWDRRSAEEAKNEAAALVREILAERLKPRDGYLDLGLVVIEDDDLLDYTTEKLADRAIEEFRDLGIKLPR